MQVTLHNLPCVHGSLQVKSQLSYLHMAILELKQDLFIRWPFAENEHQLCLCLEFDMISADMWLAFAAIQVCFYSKRVKHESSL